MKKLLILLVVLTLAATSSFAQRNLNFGRLVSFQSVNYPTKYIRHQGFAGKITDIKSALDKNDASFKSVPALDGRKGYVSLESVNYPGYYLRHQGFILKLHKKDGSELFNKDASFKSVKGLSGEGISLQSSNYPDHYIRHQGFVLKLQKSDGSELFNKDVSFVVKNGLARNNTLKIGKSLKAGQSLTSANGAYMLRMQSDDGNLCIYKINNGEQGAFVWGSMKYGFLNATLTMQEDGNLVVTDGNGEAKWSSETHPFFNEKFRDANNKPVKMVLANDGTLKLHAASGAVVWTSK